MATNGTLLASLQDGQWHSLDKLKEKADESIVPLELQCQHLLTDSKQFEAGPLGLRWKTPQSLLLPEHWLLPTSVTAVVGECLGSTSDSVTRIPLVSEVSISVAETQMSGRGRRGQRWLSPAARNLYFSIRYTHPENASFPEGLSLAVGIAVAKSLRSLCGGVAVKWPNDIYLDGRKLGGVLCELRACADGRYDVVVGVGINVNMHDYDLDLGQPWVSLSHVLGEQDRNDVMRLVLAELLPVLACFAGSGQDYIRTHWQQFDALLGRDVRALMPSGQKALGVGAGIDDRGCFLLDVGSETMVLDSADASLRLV